MLGYVSLSNLGKTFETSIAIQSNRALTSRQGQACLTL